MMKYDRVIMHNVAKCINISDMHNIRVTIQGTYKMSQ